MASLYSFAAKDASLLALEMVFFKSSSIAITFRSKTDSVGTKMLRAPLLKGSFPSRLEAYVSEAQSGSNETYTFAFRAAFLSLSLTAFNCFAQSDIASFRRCEMSEGAAGSAMVSHPGSMAVWWKTR